MRPALATLFVVRVATSAMKQTETPKARSNGRPSKISVVRLKDVETSTTVRAGIRRMLHTSNFEAIVGWQRPATDLAHVLLLDHVTLFHLYSMHTNITHVCHTISESVQPVEIQFCTVWRIF